MATRGGRIVCPRCGTNNFDTVSVCWKCGGSLAGGSASASMAAAPPSYGAPAAAAVSASPAEAFAYRAASGAGLVGNPNVANRAALWLGLLMPYFGLPIALAFMMCDDRRRQEVGRICLIWSIVSGVIHFLFMFVAMLGMQQLLMSFVGGLRGMRGVTGGGLE